MRKLAPTSRWKYFGCMPWTRRMRARSARASSCVVTRPESPMPPRFFDGKKLVAPKSPDDIVERPFQRAPIDWAASSITRRRYLVAKACRASRSPDWPKRCTGMIARVRGPTFRAASSRSRLKWCGLTSTQTGVAPRRATEPAVAKKVNDGSRTSSPSPISSAMSASRSASVPEETPRACFTPRNAAQSFSKASSRGPMMNMFERRTSRKAASNCASRARFCGPRSRSGTFVMAQMASPTVGPHGQHHSVRRRAR